MVSGSCLCGENVYEGEGELTLMHHCHCSMCRKFHGSAFATVVAVPAEGFRYVRGGTDCRRYESSPGFERVSCRTCGSPLPGNPSDGIVYLPAGQLEGDPGVRSGAHIHVASKAPWFAIEDGLPEFDTYPPGFDLPVHPTPASTDPSGAGTRGSCLCGAVAFRIVGPPLIARNCHCSRCRKVRGAAFASNLVAPLESVQFTRGADRLREYRLPGARYFTHAFCEACGSSLPRLDSERGISIVAMGALDDAPEAEPAEHIWVGSGAAWYDIPGGLPMFQGAPPG